jgi:hypothetical protein
MITGLRWSNASSSFLTTYLHSLGIGFLHNFSSLHTFRIDFFIQFSQLILVVLVYVNPLGGLDLLVLLGTV